MNQTCKLVMCVLCCPNWYHYFSFIHSGARSYDIITNVYNGINTTLWKVLFAVFMLCCGWGIIGCVLTCVGCVHCFGEPFQNYKSGSTWVESFYKFGLEPKCEFEGKIQGILEKMFKH